jgi:hypothetical protein
MVVAKHKVALPFPRVLPYEQIKTGDNDQCRFNKSASCNLQKYDTTHGENKVRSRAFYGFRRLAKARFSCNLPLADYLGLFRTGSASSLSRSLLRSHAEKDPPSQAQPTTHRGTCGKYGRPIGCED